MWLFGFFPLLWALSRTWGLLLSASGSVRSCKVTTTSHEKASETLWTYKPMSPNTVWLEFGYEWRITLITLTLPVEAVLIGKAFTVSDDCFHAGFWKAWGFCSPTYREAFLWNLGWRLLHWCNRFCTRWHRLTLILWTLHFPKHFFCWGDPLKTEHLHWYFKHICVDRDIVFSVGRIG